MGKLVHLAPEPLHKRIERSGLRGEAWTIPVHKTEERIAEAIFAMPWYPDEQVTFQWIREMRSWREGARMVAVTFDVDADTEVFFGRFGAKKQRGNHHDAYTAILADPMGSEVIAKGPIPKNKIVSVRSIRQDIGWQGTPTPSTHGDCACPACLPKGDPKFMRRVRAQFHAAIEKIHGAQGDSDQILSALSAMSLALERGRARLQPTRILSLMKHSDPSVRTDITAKLSYFNWQEVEAHVLSLLEDPAPKVREKALQVLLSRSGLSKARKHAGEDPKLLESLCLELDYIHSPEATATLNELAKHPHAAVRAVAQRSLQWRES